MNMIIMNEVEENTHSNQSMVKSSEISSAGPSTAANMTWSNINDPLGIFMPDIEVNRHVIVTVTNWPALKIMPLSFVRKIDEIPKNTDIPSVLTLAPIGKTNRTIRESMPSSFSAMRNVIGSVAALQIISITSIKFVHMK